MGKPTLSNLKDRRSRRDGRRVPDPIDRRKQNRRPPRKARRESMLFELRLGTLVLRGRVIDYTDEFDSISVSFNKGELGFDLVEPLSLFSSSSSLQEDVFFPCVIHFSEIEKKDYLFSIKRHTVFDFSILCGGKAVDPEAMIDKIKNMDNRFQETYKDILLIRR